jgi:uncharacterized protein YndB with AHSA1/START domain
MTDNRDERPIEHRGRIIRIEMRPSATPEQVYEAWADPEEISRWFPDKAEGQAEPGATITWIFDKFNYRIPYEVLIAQPAERFAIRWNPPPGMNAGIIEVTIAKDGGETVMRFVNSGFGEGAEWDEQYEGIDSGWHMALALLKHYLENYYGTPRSSFLVMHPAEFAFEQIPPFHRNPGNLAKWLTTSGAFGEVGEKFHLELQEGGTVSGRVLAKTKSEVALAWDEIHGSLELKAFPMGPQKMLCVRGCGWGLRPDKAKAIEAQMERALERLARVLRANQASA